jgi:hypothetical protein
MNDLKDAEVKEIMVEDNVPDKEHLVKTDADFDSGWTYDDNSSLHIKSFEHNLDQIPSQIVIWFSPDKETVYPKYWSWHTTLTGNPVTITMDSKFIKLAITTGGPLHGAWDPGTNRWSKFRGGYWRIFAYR